RDALAEAVENADRAYALPAAFEQQAVDRQLSDHMDGTPQGGTAWTAAEMDPRGRDRHRGGARRSRPAAGPPAGHRSTTRQGRSTTAPPAPSIAAAKASAASSSGNVAAIET